MSFFWGKFVAQMLEFTLKTLGGLSSNSWSAYLKIKDSAEHFVEQIYGFNCTIKLQLATCQRFIK